VATGPVTYADTDANEAELSTFADALREVGGDFTDALGEALRVEYKAAHRHAYLLQIEVPDLALERHLSYADRPISDFARFVERVITRINKALRNVPRKRVRLHVCWSDYESPHDKDVPLRDILPAILDADDGAYLLPFANPRHQHEIKFSRDPSLGTDQSLIVGDRHAN
jgi:5-methyltetrahydropteroyltriglutamate--homocysteine methyltransferase